MMIQICTDQFLRGLIFLRRDRDPRYTFGGLPIEATLPKRTGFVNSD